MSRIRASGHRGPTLVAVVVLASFASAGCGAAGESDRRGALSAERFVAVMVELRQAERGLDPDSVPDQFESRKREILERHRVSEEDLRDFVRRHHARPGLMVAVWDSVSERLQAPPPTRATADDTARADTTPAAPGRPELLIEDVR